MIGLHSRGNGGDGSNRATPQPNYGQQNKVLDQRPMMRSTARGVFWPPGGYFERPVFTFGKSRPEFRKYPRKNFRNKFTAINDNVNSPEIDLIKPWVTEEIKHEEYKKQELLRVWKTTRNNDDWNKFIAQKQAVQFLYEKSKSDYSINHPYEAVLWENISTTQQFCCETCDKSFKDHKSLILHEAEHETCGRDGCTFTAHPKIIAKHIKMQHASGLYRRIGKLYTEEDIAKWIEERKKRYPTRKVVEEKKILEQEKLSRGERIKDNSHKFNKSFQSKNKGAKKKFEKRSINTARNQRERKKKKNIIVKKCSEEENFSTRKGIPAFSGIKCEKNLEESNINHLNISDDEWEAEETVTKSSLNNSLGLLAELYDSDEKNQNENLKQETIVEYMSSDEGSSPEEVKTITCRKPLPKEESCISSKKFLADKKENQRKRKKKFFNNSDVEKNEIRITLLEKLLKNEIRHERNVILQCVNYIVKNNFFRM